MAALESQNLPFEICRFVIIGSFDERNTALVDALTLGRADLPLPVELVGVEGITDILRSHPWITRDHLGTE